MGGIFKGIIFGTAVVGLLAAAGRAGESRIVVNTGSDGAAITGDVHGFPLLVSLDRRTFDFASSPSGDGLRFVKADGVTPLPHQIDRWDAAQGRAEIWVGLDTVRGGSRDQHFLMRWGGTAGAPPPPAAVFDTSLGFLGAWHLGGTGSRPNSVPGGNPAEPRRFDGDESRAGVIGLADSLDGGPEGDYLDLGPGFADFSTGFTYTVWAAESAPLHYAKLLDLGNAAGRDNITLFRVETSDDLAFRVFADTSGSPRIVAPSALSTGSWHHYAVTVSGRIARIYRDGAPIRSDTLLFPIPKVARLLNFLGRSHWATNDCFRGKIDEPTLSRVARSADWIRLAHATQRPGSAVVRLEAACAPVFALPPDTSGAESTGLRIAGRAECALWYAWSQVAGPLVRIFDPESHNLEVTLPAVAADTSILLRFTARFPDGERSGLVRVRVRDSPDPVALPAARIPMPGAAGAPEGAARDLLGRLGWSAARFRWR